MNPDIFDQHYQINKQKRNQQNKHDSVVVWFTGLSGSGKSTLAGLLEKKLYEKGFHTYILDGDNIRKGLNKDLTFSDEDRKENIRRAAEMVKILIDAGVIVITAFISPFNSERKFVRSLFEKEKYLEIFVDCPIEICEQRDTKGLYKKARTGEIKNFTGINSPFERPTNPDMIIKTDQVSKEEAIEEILKKLLPKIKLG